MLLFDLDGTLIDSNCVWARVDHIFLERRGLRSTPEYRRVMGHSILPTAADFTREYFHLPDSSQEIMDEWLSLARRDYAETVAPKPGVRAFLDRCRDAGEEMVLATACVPELCEAALEHLELAPYFSDIVYAQELGVEKHDPRYFDALLRQVGSDAGACTFFDDSPGACRTAAEAGLRVVGVYDPFYESAQEEIRSLVHRYIHSFEELL